MSKLSIINKLIYLENVMCVYRNYFSLGIRTKRFVILRILIEIAAYLFVYQRFLHTSLRIFRATDNINFYFLLSYNFFSFTNNLSVIILSVYRAEYFKEFVASIDSVYNLNKDDELYQLAMKKLNKRFFCVSLLSLIIAVALVSLYGSLIIENSNNLIVIDLFFDVIFQLRYFFSSFAFYVLIEIVIASMQYLNCDMEEALGMLNGDKEGFLEIGGVLSQICYKLKKLNQTCRDSTSASASLNKCFGVQIAISFATDTLYYIILAYQGITLCIEKVPQYKTGSQSFLFLLVVYLLIKVLIVLAGQRVRNETVRLNTALARLNNSLVAIPGSCARKLRRMATDLRRELHVRPLRVRLLTSLVQMSLLMQILSIVLNYTIILLQFNHVI